MSLKEAAQKGLDALEIAMETPINEYLPAECLNAIKALRAALAEDAMQRLTDVQQEMEQPVTECHDLEQARSVAIRKLLAHFGITSANSDVNAVYLHTQINDFLMAAIDCNKEWDKLSPPVGQSENALGMVGFDLPPLPSPDYYDPYDEETPFFSEEQMRKYASDAVRKNADRFPDLSKTSDHIPDAGKMVATVKQALIVEPVAYVTGYSKGRCIIEVIDPAWLLPVGMALYRSPPTSQESRQVEPVHPEIRKMWEDYFDKCFAAPPKRKPLTDEEITDIFINGGRDQKSFCRAIERAHGIGGEE